MLKGVRLFWLIAGVLLAVKDGLKIIDNLNQLRIEENYQVEPLIFADSEQARSLHDLVWSLLWLKPRFVRGTDRHFERIPEISFKLGDNFFEMQKDSWFATYPSKAQKYVNVTITIQKTTARINQLRDEAELQQLQQIDNQEAGKTGFIKEGYRYFLEGRYTCRDPARSPLNDRCEYWQYFLDSIIVRITKTFGR